MTVKVTQTQTLKSLCLLHYTALPSHVVVPPNIQVLSQYFLSRAPVYPTCSHITVVRHTWAVQAVFDLISKLNFTWNTVFRLKPLAAELRRYNLNISCRGNVSTSQLDSYDGVKFSSGVEET